MLTVTDVSLQFAGSTLYKHVDLKFAAGNCYGIIGANGAGKSTLLRILSGALEPTTGSVTMGADDRMSVLEQDHFKYDAYNVMDTVIMGNRRLYDIMKEKEALYAKEDFTDADGEKAAELEGEFAEMNGWEAETEADQLLNGLGIPMDLHTAPMSALDGRQKVKVLLAQALFGRPSIVLLDEPTNGLDIESIDWLEEFLMDYPGTIIVVSHDRHFLNAVCTHIVDIDYNKVQMYAGNYDFWYESSQLMQQLIRNQNKKKEEKIRDLQNFIQRFSANKSKSKQATSRKKILDSITLEEMPASSRKYPYVGFEPEREAGKDILFVEGITKTVDGVKVLDHVSFIVGHGDKIAFVGDNENAHTALFQILTGELEPDEGTAAIRRGRRVGLISQIPVYPEGWTTEDVLREAHSGLRAMAARMQELEGLMATDSSEALLKEYDKLADDFRRLGGYDMDYERNRVANGLDIPAEMRRREFALLSGGEKPRVNLARLILEDTDILLLDEPTNHLDMRATEWLEDYILHFRGTVLAISHDRYFLDVVAQRCVEITDGKAELYSGNYSFYRGAAAPL